MGRVKSLRNGSGAAATAARAGAAVWACRPAAGEESAAALEQQRAMAAIRAIFRVWGCARWPLYRTARDNFRWRKHKRLLASSQSLRVTGLQPTFARPGASRAA